MRSTYLYYRIVLVVVLALLVLPLTACGERESREPTTTITDSVHVVGINRDQSPQEALDATGQKQYTTRSVVDTMPKGEGESVELKFFELDYNATPKELDAEYERRGLKGDPRALAKHMEDNPSFADDRPVATQWDLGEDGEASYTAFGRWRGERRVDVNRLGNRWIRHCRFAGVSK